MNLRKSGLPSFLLFTLFLSDRYSNILSQLQSILLLHKTGILRFSEGDFKTSVVFGQTQIFTSSSFNLQFSFWPKPVLLLDLPTYSTNRLHQIFYLGVFCSKSMPTCFSHCDSNLGFNIPFTPAIKISTVSVYLGISVVECSITNHELPHAV